MELELILEKKYSIRSEENLNKAAIINLKKIGGGKTADSEQSSKTLFYGCHARKFQDAIREQIKSISPSIIICCGNFGEVKQLIKVAGSKKEYEKFSLYDNDQMKILDVYHPSARVNWEKYKDWFSSLLSLCKTD